MTGPSFENLPLSNMPYYSRVAQDPTKYQMVAFRPGYPLQNSELNEIQDMFYVQQSLTVMMWANWCTYKVASTPNSTGPGWEGATPLQPSLLEFNESVLTINPGWYLCKLKTSGFYIWLYNSLPQTKFGLQTIIDQYYIGFSISTQGVDAAGNVVGVGGFVTCKEDQGLRYTTNTGVGPCGADRYKVQLTAVGTSAAGFSETFLPIAQRKGDSIYFMNNTQVGTV